MRGTLIWHSQRGFTLYELMVSLAIFAAVLVSSLSVLTAAHHLSEESRQRLIALHAARSVLETVKNTPLADVPDINPVAPISLSNSNIAINLSWAGQPGVPIEDVDQATVTVRVVWTGPKNLGKIVELSTIRSRFS